MLRAVDTILTDQNIKMPALVKAAHLNAEHEDVSFSLGALSIAEALTSDPDEVNALRAAIEEAGEYAELEAYWRDQAKGG